MIGALGSCCCLGCDTTCLFGADTADGCCHREETLLLWNERPAFTVSQHYVLAGGSPPDEYFHEVCFTNVQAEMLPVQSIYHFDQCVYRVVYPTTSAVDLVELPLGTGDDIGIGEGCADPICVAGWLDNPGDCSPATTDHCCSLTSNDFTCNHEAWWGGSPPNGKGGLSDWRREVMIADDARKWFIELVGHNDSMTDNLSPTIGSLYSTLEFQLFHEKWWRIPDPEISAECPSDVSIVVPSCDGGECSGIPFDSTELVPRWWIFGCSGIHVHSWELADALEMGVIDGTEATAIAAAIATNAQMPQAAIRKFAQVYGRANDWRSDQRQIYVDLNTRFPGAGYAPLIEDCSDMPLLAPFRKRLTNTFAELSVSADLVPILHKNDVITELSSLQATWIAYPGAVDGSGLPTSAEDYLYWRERQWVYFSGIPAGWTWGGWTASEEDLLDGIDREGGLSDLLGGPLRAFMGEPRPSGACTPCSPIPCGGYTYCDICANSCDDAVGPIGGCSAGDPAVCNRFVLQPYCEGIRFVYSRYYYSNNRDAFCNESGEHKCLMSVKSYLTGAKRSTGGWVTTCPYACNRVNLPPFKDWGEVESVSVGLQEICNGIYAPPPQTEHQTADLCCGDYCENPNNDVLVCTEIIEGLPIDTYRPCGGVGVHNDCPANEDCPPHTVVNPSGVDSDQENCIGHIIEDCDP